MPALVTGARPAGTLVVHVRGHEQDTNICFHYLYCVLPPIWPHPIPSTHIPPSSQSDLSKMNLSLHFPTIKLKPRFLRGAREALSDPVPAYCQALWAITVPAPWNTCGSPLLILHFSLQLPASPPWYPLKDHLQRWGWGLGSLTSVSTTQGTQCSLGP
jgi:hypothetical protein